MKCIRCIVSGRVQGVFFRRSAQRRAAELGVSGWAHNLPDGTVEVLACGEDDAVETMRHWLWRGPPGASVSDVQWAPAEPPAGLEGFEVR